MQGISAHAVECAQARAAAVPARSPATGLRARPPATPPPSARSPPPRRAPPGAVSEPPRPPKAVAPRRTKPRSSTRPPAPARAGLFVEGRDGVRETTTDSEAPSSSARHRRWSRSSCTGRTRGEGATRRARLTFRTSPTAHAPTMEPACPKHPRSGSRRSRSCTRSVRSHPSCQDPRGRDPPRAGFRPSEFRID